MGGLAKRLEELAYAEKWLVGGAIIGAASGVFVVLFYQLLSTIVGLGARFLGVEGGALEATDISVYAVMASPLRLALLIIAGVAVSSVIVYRLAPEAEGHGTDAAVAAFHKRAASIPFRVPVVKLVASALAIGTGSSGGVEGPSVQMGAGVGSTLARIAKMALEDRRIALVAGIAGALSAMFRAPLGSAFFAAEVLYKRDLEAQALMPAMVSSLVSYAVTAPYFHYSEPLPSISVEPRILYSPLTLLSLLALAVYVAPFSLLYVRLFHSAKGLFETVRRRYGLPQEAKPLLGALAASAVIAAFPLTAGSGRGVLAQVVEGRVPGGLPLEDLLPLAASLAVLAVAKIVATSLSIGSGASGGVFAPALLAGGLLGLSFYTALGASAPDGVPASVYAYVGMASFFGAAAKVPLAVSIMVGEMGKNYFLIAPTLAAAYLARELTGQESIYESQIVERPPRKAVDAEALLSMLREAGEEIDITLEELVDETVKPLTLRDPLARGLERLMYSHGLPVPVVDSRGRLVGVIDPEDAERLVELAAGDLDVPLGKLPLRRPPVLPVYETVDKAVEAMVEYGTEYVVVVEDGGVYRGIVTLEEIEVSLAFIVAGFYHVTGRYRLGRRGSLLLGPRGA